MLECAVDPCVLIPADNECSALNRVCGSPNDQYIIDLAINVGTSGIYAFQFDVTPPCRLHIAIAIPINVLEVKSFVLVIGVITSSTFDSVGSAMSTIAFHPTYVSEKDSFHRCCSIYDGKDTTLILVYRRKCRLFTLKIYISALK